jgi:hypothetical protein
MNKYLIIAVVILTLSLIGTGKYCLEVIADRNRIEGNFEQIGKQNSVLNLKVGELGKLNTEASHKLDSVMKANKIKPKQLVSATITKIQYKDTGSVKIVYKTPVMALDSTYTIGVSYSDSCWSMKGSLLSKDPKTTFVLVERTASNNVQLLVTQKRFLGFLWVQPKKQKHRIFSDCGEVEFTQINMVK